MSLPRKDFLLRLWAPDSLCFSSSFARTPLAVLEERLASAHMAKLCRRAARLSRVLTASHFVLRSHLCRCSLSGDRTERRPLVGLVNGRTRVGDTSAAGGTTHRLQHFWRHRWGRRFLSQTAAWGGVCTTSCMVLPGDATDVVRPRGQRWQLARIVLCRPPKFRSVRSAGRPLPL